MKMRVLLAIGLAVLFLPGITEPPRAIAEDAAGAEFFEKKIRPVLVEHCYACHSNQARQAKKLQGGLFLDSATGVAAGGESGAVLVKGKPSESRLISALKHEGLEMPPSGKLPDEVVADFAKWIEMGAPDPRTGDQPLASKREINLSEGKKWWAFQPLSVKPVTENDDGSRTIDDMILKPQRARNLRPNYPASREKLIRRAYFDLIGLPPTPEEAAKFVTDSSPQAFQSVVDELLANSGFGERWARHWLDAARFAESGGYEFDGFRPGAYHYRDWVIRALNSDLPYDQFVRMQLAGDVLFPDDLDAAAATGFLVAGPYPGQITAKTVERIRYDQIDDMLMTIGGSMLGLTLGCVRCHEHKYDPIPHQDYYALAASLARTVHGTRSFDIDPASTERALEKYQAEHEPLVQSLNAFAEKELPTRFAKWQKTELRKQPEAPRWQILSPVAFQAQRSYLKELPGSVLAHDGLLSPGTNVRERGQRRRVGGDEAYRLTFHTHQKNVQSLRLDAFTDKSLPQRGPGLNADGSFLLAELTVTARPLDPEAKDAPQELKLKPVFAAFEDQGQPLSNAVDGKPATAWVIRTNAKKDNAAIFELQSPLAGFTGGTELAVELKFKDQGIGRLRLSLSVEENPATWAGDLAPQHAGEMRAIAAAYKTDIPEIVRAPLARWFAPFDEETGKVFRAVGEHAAKMPRPKLTEVYTTIAGGQDVHYLRRGEVDNKQEKAEPGFLQVLSRFDKPETRANSESEGDSRVALANWICDVDGGAGALLARVIVNRLWQHHFGQGIVRTPNDFGAQGDPPTHPELLEFLAAELVRGGWKLKPIHRMIMLSDVYRQSHEVDPENQKVDPENFFLWHFQPRRLEAETIRDALLAAGGNLDKTMYGPSELDGSLKRGVYLRVKRSELLPVMTMFDAPEPTQSIGQRSVTTVPTQALALMNSPLVRQQAEKLYQRIKPKKTETPTTAIDRGWRIAFGRSPTDQERDRLLLFFDEQRKSLGDDSPESTEKALTEMCHVLLCLNEFVYID